MREKKANHGTDRDRSQPPPAGIARLLRGDSGGVGYVEVDLMQTRWQQAWQRLAATLKARGGELLRQFRILTRALVHPAVPWYAKLVCGCSVLYVASPIQLIPNFIPVIGQLDDVLVIGLSIRLLKRSVPPTVLEECQNGSGSPIVSAIPLNLPIGPSPALRPEGSPPGFCQ
jgi:uncharacterized membrane protein YkvA (DUF1232 family)